MYNNRIKGSKGFTLIELLVVIAIIAILSTVVMAGLNSARSKGRDASRLSSIKSLQSALELFSDSCQGYPNLAVGVITTGSAADSAAVLTTGENDTATITDCATPMSTFIAQMPGNPGPNGEAYQYCGTASAIAPAQANPPTTCGAAGSSSYLIGFNLENVNGSLTPAGDHQASPGGMF